MFFGFESCERIDKELDLALHGDVVFLDGCGLFGQLLALLLERGQLELHFCLQLSLSLAPVLLRLLVALAPSLPRLFTRELWRACHLFSPSNLEREKREREREKKKEREIREREKRKEKRKERERKEKRKEREKKREKRNTHTHT